MNPIRRRPCADPGQKPVPGEWMTQKGIDSSRPVTEASRAKLDKAHERSHHRFRRIQPGLPRAMVLTAYFVLSPATNSSCHRHPRIKGLYQARSGRLASTDLTPATGARTTRLCRPRAPISAKGFDGLSAVRPRAIRQLTGRIDPPCHPLTSPDAAASTASRPAFVTTRDHPSVGRDGANQ